MIVFLLIFTLKPFFFSSGWKMQIKNFAVLSEFTIDFIQLKKIVFLGGGYLFNPDKPKPSVGAYAMWKTKIKFKKFFILFCLIWSEKGVKAQGLIKVKLFNLCYSWQVLSKLLVYYSINTCNCTGCMCVVLLIRNIG